MSLSHESLELFKSLLNQVQVEAASDQAEEIVRKCQQARKEIEEALEESK